MKIYKLEYQSKVMGIRISYIPNCRYSLDLECELAKKVLSYIDKNDLVNGGTLSLKIKDNLYVTENEVDVINISSVKECLRYINSDNADIREVEISSSYLTSYAERKLNRMLPEILGSTGLKYNDNYKGGKKFVELFFKKKEKKDKPNPYDKIFGIRLNVKYLNSVITITAEVLFRETIYRRMLPDYCYDFHSIATYKKDVSIDKSIFTVGYYSWYAPAVYVEELLNPFFKEIVEFFKLNIPKIAQELSDDNVSSHLNDFLPLSKDKLIELISIYPKCYYYKKSGTPIYSELSSTEEHLQEMSKSYDIIMGFRRYLVWNNELYLWFGDDEQCSWWC